MFTVDFTEFRKNASALLSRVEAGEVIEIRRHGKVVARLTPAVDAQTVPAWKKPGLRLPIAGEPLSETVLKDRR